MGVSFSINNRVSPPLLKVRLDTLVNDHQRSLEDLKTSLSSQNSSAEGQEQDPQELRTTLESLRMEHQLELENLKARHEIEAAVLAKEREDLRSRLQDAKDQLGESSQNGKNQAQTEARSNQLTLELRDAREELQKAQLRVGEVERLQGEKDGAQDELRERLELAEKKMVDYEALQKAEAQSRAELHSLEEKLRVTENRLQAVQDDHHMPQDANVSPPGNSCGSISCRCYAVVHMRLESFDSTIKLTKVAFRVELKPLFM